MAGGRNFKRMQRQRREAERRQKAETKRQRRLDKGQKSTPAVLSEGERKEEPLREVPLPLSRGPGVEPASLPANTVVPEQARLRWILRALSDSAELTPSERESLAIAAKCLAGEGVLSAQQRKQLEKLYRERG
jgi:hypothetical protein